MSESQYRSAKTILTKHKFATFKSTNKGTIAKLADHRLFKVNPATIHNQKASDPRPTDGLPATNLNLKSIKQENDKAFPTKKSNKLSTSQKSLADRFEQILGIQWTNDSGKWINRIKTEFGKTERVAAEVGNGIKELRIKTTPAQYAEQIWKEFK
jgi:hypothetical protein